MSFLGDGAFHAHRLVMGQGTFENSFESAVKACLTGLGAGDAFLCRWFGYGAENDCSGVHMYTRIIDYKE
ncbi:hypothetical protein E4K67_02505 [Desulfosporosinus fructosivorans]|uniref:Uncharacterized protein n=1 Tax=Desulfosporosinus fructosivorans TaxID=2018669 RepID=A0A4Z0RCH3_9FIRM|nr:hypothetical protein [Desulfosporosinus fructosivorans]TGE39877.1 hypothetical protein E4K67_02505 [Desulfosporosinus fructosivorans]